MKKTVKEKQEENQNPSDLHAQVLSVSIEGGGMDMFMCKSEDNWDISVLQPC